MARHCRLWTLPRLDFQMCARLVSSAVAVSVAVAVSSAVAVFSAVAVDTIGTGGTASGNGQTGEAGETIGTGGTVEAIGNKHRQLLQIRPRSRLLPSRHHPARTTRSYTAALLLAIPLWLPIGEGALQGSSRAPASVRVIRHFHHLRHLHHRRLRHHCRTPLQVRGPGWTCWLCRCLCRTHQEL